MVIILNGVAAVTEKPLETVEVVNADVELGYQVLAASGKEGRAMIGQWRQSQDGLDNFETVVGIENFLGFIVKFAAYTEDVDVGGAEAREVNFEPIDGNLGEGVGNAGEKLTALCI